MDDNLTNKIAKFIREKRFALGISQREFAILVFGDERKRQMVTAIESGRPITVNTLDRILTALHSDVDLVEL